LAAPPSRSIDGMAVATEILLGVGRDLAEMTARGHRPRLVSLAFGKPAASDDDEADFSRVAISLGVGYAELKLDAASPLSDALCVIDALNADPAITAILLRRPLPPHLDAARLHRAIRSAKNIEGLHPGAANTACAAAATLELLRRREIRLAGMEALLVGPGELASSPLALLLLGEGVTVTLAAPESPALAAHARRADLLFLAGDRAVRLSDGILKPDAIVVDFAAAPLAHAALMRGVAQAAGRQGAKASESRPDRLMLSDLKLMASIGAYPHEEQAPQPIRVNLELEAERGGDGFGVVDYDDIAASVRGIVAAGHIRLVEDLADRIAEHCLADRRVKSVRVRVEKTAAIRDAAAAGVEIVRP
jgi:methylenetetrahydrofolate dehydrogenase (NADP+)/methenyltetrahydrofolate cyclohydrolase